MIGFEIPPRVRKRCDLDTEPLPLQPKRQSAREIAEARKRRAGSDDVEGWHFSWEFHMSMQFDLSAETAITSNF